MKTAIEIGNEMIEAASGRKGMPMSENQCEVMLNLIVMEKNNLELPEEAQNIFLYQVLTKRLEAANISYNKVAAFMLAAMCDRVGAAVLYAATLAAMNKQLGRDVTLTDISSKFFPWGFPSEEEQHRIWDLQKGQPGEKVDNWLDQYSAWK